MKRPTAGNAQRTLSRRVLIAVLALGVAAVVSAGHWPVLSVQALAFDDAEFITNNPLVQNPGWVSTKRFLTEVFEPSTVHGYYIPLTMISLMADYAAGGRADDLRQFHRTNLALHVMTAVALFFFMVLLFDRPWVAAMLALIYGLHPLTVEPVAWVGERKTVLATCLALWSLVLYVTARRRNDRLILSASVALFILAVMSKPTTVPLPVLLLLLDWWPLGGVNVRRLLEKIPYLLVACVSTVVTIVSNARTANITAPIDAPIAPLLLKICHNFFFYLQKIIWPVGLTSFYQPPQPFTFQNSAVLAGVVLTVVAVVAVAAFGRRIPSLACGALFFLVALVPTLGIVGFSWINASDKYLYLPIVGLLLPSAHLLCTVEDRAKRRQMHRGVLTGLFIAALALCCLETIGTRGYLRKWRDSETLYKHMISIAPDAAVLHYSLGNTYAQQERFAEAAARYQKAAEINPGMPDIRVGLGFALAKLGESDEAVRQFERALEINPDSAEAYNGLGLALEGSGRWEQAQTYYETAVKLRPHFLEARINLGAALLRQNRLDEAAEQFRAVLRFNPSSVEAHVNLGVTLKSAGRYDEAIRHYQAALEKMPCHPEIHRNIGHALYEQGRIEQANTFYANALFCQGVDLESKGDLSGASARYQEALRLAPRHEQANSRLRALATARDGN